MACSVFLQVGATYKGLWTKWNKNVEARKAGWTRRPEQLSGALGREVGEPRLATLRLPELERGTSGASRKQACGQRRSQETV